MKKVWITAPCREKNRKLLLQEFEDVYEIHFRETEEEKDHTKYLSEAQIIVGEPDYQEIRDHKQLEWVQMTWAGTDKYTKNGPFPDHVMLTNASGAFGVIISEYVLAGILTLYRRLPQYIRFQQEKNWNPLWMEDTIYGKEALILGTGDIGRETAKRLKAFGCHVSGIRRQRREVPYFDQTGTVEDLLAWLPQADLVICCLPNNRESMGLLNYDVLRRMKENAILVNVGRGHIFSEGALEKILQEGKIAGAVLDVQRQEPLPEDHFFWTHPNVLITPHIAGPSHSTTVDTQDRIYQIVAENLRRYAAGETLKNLAEFDKN